MATALVRPRRAGLVTVSSTARVAGDSRADGVDSREDGAKDGIR